MTAIPSPRPVDMLFPGAKRQEAIMLGFCVLPPIGCGKPVTGFDDELSEREYRISRLCQTCQDEIFGGGE